MGAWKKWQSCCRAQTDTPRPRSDPKEKKNFQKITDRQTSSWFHHHLNLVQMRETKIYFSYLPHTTWHSVLLLWCASSYLITLKFVKCLTVTNTHTLKRFPLLFGREFVFSHIMGIMCQSYVHVTDSDCSSFNLRSKVSLLFPNTSSLPTIMFEHHFKLLEKTRFYRFSLYGTSLIRV